MKIIQNISNLKKEIVKIKAKGLKISFVPTMGYLHDGHLKLIEKAKKISDFVIVSIFVNPLQFAPGEDYLNYPRDIKEDQKKLKKSKVNLLFIPKGEKIFPENFKTYVEVKDLSSKLCGKVRFSHFKGAATIVLKLFNLVKPDFAVFGKKDFQQLIIIKRMVKDLNLNIKIIPHPIIREKDGLAMSSRNSYLTQEERKKISVLYQALKEAKSFILNKEDNPVKIKKFIKKRLLELQINNIDYISICNQENLEELKVIKGKILIALAVKLRNARLIDNIDLLV
ncbi:MAG: pantoate--beta-alanine ligase [Armatimonadetes bacterium]|nr:pantoate--beta-alanine ligase [Armatimonadota bacterium]